MWSYAARVNPARRQNRLTFARRRVSLVLGGQGNVGGSRGWQWVRMGEGHGPEPDDCGRGVCFVADARNAVLNSRGGSSLGIADEDDPCGRDCGSARVRVGTRGRRKRTNCCERTVSLGHLTQIIDGLPSDAPADIREELESAEVMVAEVWPMALRTMAAQRMDRVAAQQAEPWASALRSASVELLAL